VAAEGDPRFPLKSYSPNMRQFATVRLAQAAEKYADSAPMATACCNACRTCVQTNLLTLAAGVGAGLVTAIRRRVKLTAPRSSAP